MTTLRSLRAIPPVALPDVDPSALRYELPDLPLVVVTAPLAASPAEIRATARRLREIPGVASVVLPHGWRLEALAADGASPESRGPRACPSCDAPVTADGCPLCDVGLRR